MKKIVCAALVLLLGLGKMEALPVGNPAQASLFVDQQICCEPSEELLLQIAHLRVGYYGDFVFQRDLETDNHRKVDFSRIATNAAYFSLNFFERAELFTTLGATRFKFNTSLGPFNSTNTSPRFELATSPAFSWSLGAHATLFRCKCLTLGMMGQYFQCHPKPRVLFIRADVGFYPDATTHRKYEEWQVGLGLAYRYNRYFVPYVAAKYNRACWHFHNETFVLADGNLATIPSLRSAKDWGYAIGLTFHPLMCKKMAVTAEGRFADEAAVHFNALVQF